jgi:hypothetical protein
MKRPRIMRSIASLLAIAIILVTGCSAGLQAKNAFLSSPKMLAKPSGAEGPTEGGPSDSARGNQPKSDTLRDSDTPDVTIPIERDCSKDRTRDHGNVIRASEVHLNSRKMGERSLPR